MSSSMINGALVIGFLFVTIQCAEWSYSGVNGPDHWKEHYELCGEKKQSPINIYEGDVKVNLHMPSFLMTNFDKEVDLTLSNNGHSVMATLGNDSQLLLSGGGLSGTYRALQFHFHWGNLSTVGSEHLLSGYSFPLELHIVHYNLKYLNLADALAQSDGLAVLGFMYLINNEDNFNYTNIVNNLLNIQFTDAKIQLPRTKLSSLLPESYQHYYRYYGSLTTPTCDQSVIWTVFTDPIYISEKQLAEFRTIFDSHNQTLVNNYRPIQPVNNRIVTANFEPHIHWQYQNGEHEHWKDLFEACGGSSQSPINIVENNTKAESTIPLLAFHNYEKPSLSGTILKNNGHTVELELVGDEITISAGGLPEHYIAKQFHFHWGSDLAQGSEHQLDHKSFPMELHIVHFRKSLRNITTAASQYHGLAVLGFFFEISQADNIGLTEIINNLNNINIPGRNVNIPGLSLNSFLPLHKSDFYRYDGSLTTPGCSESVIWTVFKETVKISEKQLAVFRQVRGYEDNILMPMVNNYRPVQPINSRVIKRNFNVPPPKAHWSYDGSHGTDNWKHVFKFCSNTPTSRQSPIDISPAYMKYATYEPLNLEGYDSINGVTLDLKNNGHSVQAEISGGNMFISGAGLPGTYRASQFHFHWGALNKRGSEHSIEGRTFPLEVHIVHYNIEQPDIIKATTEKGGLAVLGILFELSEAENKGYEKVIDALEIVQYPYSRFFIDSINLRQMLPINLKDFYRYEGSLTTPECHETVTWTVFKETLKISEKQMAKFRSIFTESENHVLVPLIDNYRPIQPINNRVITTTFPFSVSSAVDVHQTLVTITITSFIVTSQLKMVLY